MAISTGYERNIAAEDGYAMDKVLEKSSKSGPSLRAKGWRAVKGPNPDNKSGLRATGHRLLLATQPVEQKTESGIIFIEKTLEKEKNVATVCTVVEIGHDCWSDKSTDYCQVGDKVLVGQYVGKFQTSHKDGKEYRFVADLDVISTLED